jgi:NAD(P)-dependent dehydrogenase (short-subunit alcohol dehydrogenase family)
MSHLNEYRGHALVTNTSLGIGAAIASRLLHDDRHVTGLDRAEKTISAPYFASLTHDLLDADAVRSALVAIEVDAFVHAAGFMRVGELGSLDLAAGTDMWGVTVATRQRLPRGGRIRADCDGNADAGRFGPGQRATRLPRSAALSGPRKSLRPPRFCCPKRLPRSRANSS